MEPSQESPRDATHPKPPDPPPHDPKAPYVRPKPEPPALKPFSPLTEPFVPLLADAPDWLWPRKVALLDPYLPPQVIQGVLYQSCRFVFASDPKAKKSWLLMQFCFCIANQLPFLEIPTQKGKVVYVNLELLEGDCRQRFFKIQEAFNQGNLENIEVIQLRGKSRLINHLRLLQLEQIITEAKFVVCAFDPIYKLMDGKDERLGIDVAPILGCLESISEKANCSTGFAQHFAKGNQALKFAIDRISGSNYFARDADVIFIVTALSEEDTYRVDIIQRSFAEIKPFGIRWQFPIFFRDDSIDITDIRQPGKDKKTDAVKERMLAALHASNYEGGLSFSEFLSAVQIEAFPSGNPTPSKATFCRKLKELMAEKLIEKSAATEKYLLTVDYAVKRAQFFNESHEGSLR